MLCGHALAIASSVASPITLKGGRSSWRAVWRFFYWLNYELQVSPLLTELRRAGLLAVVFEYRRALFLSLFLGFI
jgi:hypothetical protein